MKSNLKILSVLLLISLFSFTSKDSDNKDFKLVSATRQTSYGGVEGSPIVTRYVVKLKALHNITLIKDSAFAEERIEAFEILADSFKSTPQLKVKKGKTVSIAFSIVTPTDIAHTDSPFKFTGSHEAQLPFPSKTGVVIRYKGGKSKFMAVDELMTIPAIYAP